MMHGRSTSCGDKTKKNDKHNSQHLIVANEIMNEEPQRKLTEALFPTRVQSSSTAMKAKQDFFDKFVPKCIVQYKNLFHFLLKGITIEYTKNAWR